MKTNITKIGAILLAVGICIYSAQVRAQTATTVTTTKGAFTEYVPGTETVVVRTETNPAPLRYVVTKQTKIVDDSGAPVAIERISPGSPLAVEYTGTGERLVASRIVVQKTAAVTAPVTTAPVTTAPVTTQDTATTTTTTRPLTREEKHDLKERQEHPKRELKKEIEKKKDALEEAKDRLDDDD